MTEAPVILVDRDDRVATVTLNRPHARNALNAELRRALRSTMAELDADDLEARRRAVTERGRSQV